MAKGKKQVFYLVDVSNGEVDTYNCTLDQMEEYLEAETTDYDNLECGDIRLFTNEVKIAVEQKISVKLTTEG